jgi:hypothetical protein
LLWKGEKCPRLQYSKSELIWALRNNNNIINNILQISPHSANNQDINLFSFFSMEDEAIVAIDIILSDEWK